MKTIVFSTSDARRITDYQVDSKYVNSVLNRSTDKNYFRFLHSRQKLLTFPYNKNFSEIILSEIDCNDNPPDNTTELDLIILKNINTVFERLSESKFLKAYVNSFFKRYHGAFESLKGHPILVISQYDDLDNLPETYKHYVFKNINCYSVIDEYNTMRLMSIYHE